MKLGIDKSLLQVSIVSIEPYSGRGPRAPSPSCMPCRHAGALIPIVRAELRLRELFTGSVWTHIRPKKKSPQ